MQMARHTLLLLIGLLWVEAVYSAAAEATNETEHLLHGEAGPIQQQAPAQGLLQRPRHAAGQQVTAAGQGAEQPTGATGASVSQNEAGADAATSGAALPPEDAAEGTSAVRRWIQQKLEDLQQTLESVPGLAPEPATATGPHDTAAVLPGTAAVTSQQEPASSSSSSSK